MKATIKALALITLVLVIRNNADAQYNKHPVMADGFQDAIGIRFGGTTGLTYKHKFSSYNAMEFILGTYPHALGITGLYERYILTNVDGLNLYVGAGAHIARGYYRSWGYSYHPHHNNADTYYYPGNYNNNYGPVVGFDAIGGAEYKFAGTPVALSFDFKPYVEFYTGLRAYCRLDPGLGIKFTF